MANKDNNQRINKVEITNDNITGRGGIFYLHNIF